MTPLINKLTELGFSEDTSAQEYFASLAAESGMDKGGPYVQHHVYTDGETFVVIEQNVGDENLGGLEATVKYPPVVIIDGPTVGRVACSPDDVELMERLLSGTADAPA